MSICTVLHIIRQIIFHVSNSDRQVIHYVSLDMSCEISQISKFFLNKTLLIQLNNKKKLIYNLKIQGKIIFHTCLLKSYKILLKTCSILRDIFCWVQNQLFELLCQINSSLPDLWCPITKTKILLLEKWFLPERKKNRGVLC